MSAYLVHETKSYTLAVSTETGEVRLELADELKENLKEMLEEADTSTEATAGLFDLVGDDAIHLVEAMDAILGMDGALSAAYLAGGVEAMEAARAEHAANNGYASDLADRLAEKETFGGFGASFIEVPSGDIADYLDWGAPAGDPYADPGSEEGKAAIEAEIGEDGLMNPWVAAAGVGAVVVIVGTGAYLGYKGVQYLTATEEKRQDDTNSAVEQLRGAERGGGDGDQMPADPDAEYGGYVDFSPPWAEDEIAPTYGQTLTNPDDERGVQGTNDFDPDAELDALIITNPDDIQSAVNSEQVREAAEFDIVTTTTPSDGPDFHFKPDFGGGIPGNEGEDFDGNGDGGLMATATEYIVSERDGELSLADTMIFNEGIQSGNVEAEGTSDGILSVALTDAEQGIHTADLV